MTKARDLANAGTALGAVTATELGYVDGVTSAIQTQLDAKTAKSTLTTTGDIYYASSASTPARLGIGSSAQVLTVAGGIPSWATPSSGGMTLINTGGTTLTGSSITISSIPATYIDLYLVVRNPLGSGDGFDFSMRFNSDTSNKYTETAGGSAGDATFPNSSLTFATGQDNGSSTALATITIPDYANAATLKMASNLTITNSWSTPANFNAIRYMGFYNSTSAISSITLFPASGTWTSGTAYLYGVK